MPGESRNEYHDTLGEEGCIQYSAQYCDLADVIISQLSAKGNAT
jgi:hypothetical protein